MTARCWRRTVQLALVVCLQLWTLHASKLRERMESIGQSVRFDLSLQTGCTTRCCKWVASPLQVTAALSVQLSWHTEALWKALQARCWRATFRQRRGCSCGAKTASYDQATRPSAVRDGAAGFEDGQTRGRP
jgi:hypothetical protein